MKVRLQNEEILTGVAVSEDIASDTLQVNPSHVKNLIKYRASLERELSEVGDEVAYRPVPSQVSIKKKVYRDKMASDFDHINRPNYPHQCLLW